MRSSAAYKRTEAELEAEKAATERAERVDVARSIEERRALESGADIEPAKQGRHRSTPARRTEKPDGLATLFAAKKLTPEQLAAGRRFAGFWRVVNRSDLQSGLASMEIRAPAGGGYSLSEAQGFARAKLSEAKRELGHHPGMWQALEKVCGEGLSPIEVTPVRRHWERLQTRLDCALTILAKLWKIG